MTTAQTQNTIGKPVKSSVHVCFAQENLSVNGESIYKNTMHVTIADNSTCTQPIHIADYIDTDQNAPSHIRVTVGQNAHAHIIDYQKSCYPPPSWSVDLSDHANITFKQHHTWKHLQTGVVTIQINAHAQSNCQYHLLTHGGTDIRYTMNVDLQGTGANVTVQIVPILKQSESATIQTEQHHRASHTTSSILVRGLVSDKGQMNCTGLVHLAPTATHANAVQKSAFLLDGDQARAYTRPVLEALTCQVHCVHGSAIGQTDKEQILYMTMRGLSDKKAERMLMQGFLTSALDDYGRNVVYQILNADE